MNDELTRLRAIRNAITDYDRHQTQASSDWYDSETCPASCQAYRDDAFDQERLAKEALKKAVQLARKEW